MVEDLHGNNIKSLQKSIQLTNISCKEEVLANTKVKVANLFACVSLAIDYGWVICLHLSGHSMKNRFNEVCKVNISRENSIWLND
jgi:hypothetical protein